MIILDENILDCQRLLLGAWRLPARQIGLNLGRKGLKDEEIIACASNDIRRFSPATRVSIIPIAERVEKGVRPVCPALQTCRMLVCRGARADLSDPFFDSLSGIEATAWL